MYKRQVLKYENNNEKKSVIIHKKVRMNLIYGVGIDLVEIERIERLLKQSKFLEKCFTGYEQEYILKKGKGAQSAAGMFAAKEAFFKAVGTGISGADLHDVEVRHDELGAPQINLYKTLFDKFSQKGFSFLLSITHTHTTAGAVVCALRLEG